MYSPANSVSPASAPSLYTFRVEPSNVPAMWVSASGESVMSAGEKSVPLELKTPKRRVDAGAPPGPLVLNVSNCQPDVWARLLWETTWPYGSIVVGLSQNETENCSGMRPGPFIISIDSLYCPRISTA